MASFSQRLQNAWNVFRDRDDTDLPYMNQVPAPSYSFRPERPRLSRGNERSIVTAVYNRIGIDCSQIKVEHVKLDEQGRYLETLDTTLNDCLTVEANKDQIGRALIQDIVMSMLDEGVVAVVPVDTTVDPNNTDSYKIETLRTGKIKEWYPDHVKVKLYDDRNGKYSDVILRKDYVAIIENPFFSVMNEPNSTLQRLIRKLNILDSIDEQSGAGKLDLIIQLPYIIKSDARRQQAETRRKDIEMQLAGSKYGIAYTDGTERITQLNRPVENHLMEQVEYLTSMLYSQLGITKEIMDGTADPKTLNNYINRTIEPIMSAIVDEFKRKFLSKTARTQRQSIMFFEEPFKLIPITELAETVDKLTRNEILTSNEVRQFMGLKPSNNPRADDLSNKNMPDAFRNPVESNAQEETVNEETFGKETRNGKI